MFVLVFKGTKKEDDYFLVTLRRPKLGVFGGDGAKKSKDIGFWMGLLED